jgi:hypothetical protein
MGPTAKGGVVRPFPPVALLRPAGRENTPRPLTSPEYRGLPMAENRQGRHLWKDAATVPRDGSGARGQRKTRRRRRMRGAGAVGAWREEADGLTGRSPSHSLLFPPVVTDGFRLEGSCFMGAGFARLFSWPEPSPPQAFHVSGELPATGLFIRMRLCSYVPDAYPRHSRQNTGFQAARAGLVFASLWGGIVPYHGGTCWMINDPAVGDPRGLEQGRPCGARPMLETDAGKRGGAWPGGSPGVWHASASRRLSSPVAYALRGANPGRKGRHPGRADGVEGRESGLYTFF